MPMTRRGLLGAASALALAPIAIRAADPGPKRITWALHLPSESERKRSGDPRDRIRESLKSRGLVEGRDFTIAFVELPAAQRKRESDEFADRLVGSEAQVIVMRAHRALFSLRTRTRSVPVVFYNVNVDPSRMGLVESLRRPGTNFTGAYLGMEDVDVKNAQLLKELVPSLSRVAIYLKKDDWEEARQVWSEFPGIVEFRAETRRTVKAQLGIDLVDVVVPGDASAVEVEAAFREARVQAVMLYWGSTRQRDTLLAATAKLPTLGQGIYTAREGLLLGVGWVLREGESYAIEAVHQIIRGQDVATIPVYKNRQLPIAINRATARRLGIEIPQAMVMRAVEIYD